MRSRVSQLAFEGADALADQGGGLAVVYLISNAGHSGRVELVGEAIRLGQTLAQLMPDEPEVHGVLAMVLLHDARSEARIRDGELVLLADQDRSLWSTTQIAPDRRRSTGL